MKKIKMLVASASMAVMFTTNVFAGAASLLPSSIIIGNKAYNMQYISNNVKQLNDILNNSTQYQKIFYNNSDQKKITNLFDGTNMTTDDLDKLYTYTDGTSTKGINFLYYDFDGTKRMYKYDVGSHTIISDESSSRLKAYVTVSSLGGIMYSVSIRIKSAADVNMNPHTLEPKYFKIYNNNNSDLIKKIGMPNTNNGEYDDDYVLNLITTDPNIRLQILSSDKVTIATTKPKALNDLSSQSNPIEFELDNYFIPPINNSTTNSNGLGNLNNGGLTSQNGDWTYYSNSGDGGGIYKTNGVQSYKICEDNAKFINVVGDWIYYSNYSDGQKIYKVKIDGTGRRIVCTDQASYISVSGEYIYYSYHSGTGVGNIKKVNRNAIKSPGANVTNDEAEFLIVSGDMIYFTNKAEGNSIYAVHTDGTYRTKISSDSAKFITLVSDKIYYVTDFGQLKWITKSGGSFGSISVSNGSTGSNAVITAMNISEDRKWMYYADGSDGNKMYRAPLVDYLKISGDKYSDDYTNFINIIGNKIYYTKGGAMLIANEPKISPNKDPLGRAIYIYTSTPMIKPKQDLKLVSYDKVAVPTKNAVGADISNLEDYLPDKVTGILSDNSVHELLVDWDLNPKKPGKGSKIQYTGTIVGYGAKVTLTLSMASEPIPAAAVKIINNAGLLDDKIYINRDDTGKEMDIKATLQVGDVIKVYRDPMKGELLGQETIIQPIGGGLLNATITLRREKTITDDAKYVYITRTSPGVLESEVVRVEIKGEPTGAPDFNLNGDPDNGKLDIIVTNYGKLLNGYTENDVVEILPTTQLQQGDIVNIYKKIGNQDVKIGSQMVEFVPSSNPFDPNRFKATISLPAGYIEYDSGKPSDTPTTVKELNKIMVTRSTQFAESKSVNAYFNKGIALPLGQLIVSGPQGDVLLRNQLDSQYDYYYKVQNKEPIIPILGAVIGDTDNPKDPSDPTKGWVKLDETNLKLNNVVNNDDVYVVQVYSDSIVGEKVLRCSHTKAAVVAKP